MVIRAVAFRHSIGVAAVNIGYGFHYISKLVQGWTSLARSNSFCLPSDVRISTSPFSA